MLYKRKKTWWVDFVSPNGERVRHSARTQDKKKAQQYHDRLKAEYWAQDQLNKKPEYTWKEAVVKWLNEKSYKATIEQDRSNLIWWDQYLGGLKLSEINRDLLLEIGQIKADETSESTANRYLALVRAILRIARDEWEWIDSIPKVRMYKVSKRRIRWLRHEEAANLLAELPAHQRGMCVFALSTGLRQGNVKGLEWTQIDLKRKVAWVHADQAKAGEPIAFPLNQDALEVLEEMRGNHDRFVFTYKGKQINQVNTAAWKKALARAGLDDFRWHDLRHTWASWMAQNGTPLNVLQEMGGWKSVEMVRRYAHFSAEHLSPYADKLVRGTNVVQTDPEE